MIQPLTPRRAILMVAKHKLALFGFLAVVLGATAAYLCLVPRQYVSTAAVFVAVDGNATPDTHLGDTEAPKPLNQDIADMIVNTHVDLFKSRDLLREALLSQGLAKVYPALAGDASLDKASVLERALDRLLNRDMAIQVGRSSSVLTITLRNPDPQVARDMLATLIAAYLKRTTALLNDPDAVFIGKQVDAAHSALDQSRQAYLDYLRKQGVTSPDEERAQLLKQRNDVEENIGEARAKMVADASSQAALSQALSGTHQQIALSNENDSTMLQVTDAQSALAAAESRYLVATQTYGVSNPLLKDAKDAVDLARNAYQKSVKSPAARVRTGVNPVFQEIEKQLALTEADLAARQAMINSWTRELQAVQTKLDHLDTVAGEVDNLSLQVKAQATAYHTFLLRSEQANAAGNMNAAGISNLSVVQAPTLPFEPTPKSSLIVGVALLLGLLGGFGLCFLLELSNQTFSHADEVEIMTGLPVFVSVRNLQPRRVRRYHEVTYAGLRALPPGGYQS